MERFLTHSIARSIAEAMWGTGGTASYRTNRPGAFYFSCSGHGGFVVDAAVLTDDERTAIDPYLEMEKAQVWRTGDKVHGVMHPYRKRSFPAPFTAKKYDAGFYLAEEDCDWSVMALKAGIFARHEGRIQTEIMTAAQATFDRWCKPRRQVQESA